MYAYETFLYLDIIILPGTKGLGRAKEIITIFCVMLAGRGVGFSPPTFLNPIPTFRIPTSYLGTKKVVPKKSYLKSQRFRFRPSSDLGREKVVPKKSYLKSPRMPFRPSSDLGRDFTDPQGRDFAKIPTLGKV